MCRGGRGLLRKRCIPLNVHALKVAQARSGRGCDSDGHRGARGLKWRVGNGRLLRSDSGKPSSLVGAQSSSLLPLRHSTANPCMSHCRLSSSSSSAVCRWCKLCRGLSRSEIQREEGAWELHHATVLLDDVPIASCGDAQCNLPIERLLPGLHTLTVTFFDPHDMLVSSSMYTIDVPLVDSMARNVALSEHGGHAKAKYTQGHFDILRSIDGVEDGQDNGGAYHGQLAEAEAIFVFSSSSRMRRIRLVSGAGRPDHHLTHVLLSYSTGERRPFVVLGILHAPDSLWNTKQRQIHNWPTTTVGLPCRLRPIRPCHPSKFGLSSRVGCVCTRWRGKEVGGRGGWGWGTRASYNEERESSCLQNKALSSQLLSGRVMMENGLVQVQLECELMGRGCESLNLSSHVARPRRLCLSLNALP